MEVLARRGVGSWTGVQEGIWIEMSMVIVLPTVLLIIHFIFFESLLSTLLVRQKLLNYLMDKVWIKK